jgi:hypothetical protein
LFHSVNFQIRKVFNKKIYYTGGSKAGEKQVFKRFPNIGGRIQDPAKATKQVHFMIVGSSIVKTKVVKSTFKDKIP